MIKVYYTNHKYGIGLPPEYGVKKLKNMKALSTWIMSLDLTPDHSRTALCNEINGLWYLGASFSTNTFNKTHTTQITLIENDNGILYSTSPYHVSKAIQSMCKELADKITKPKVYID